MQQTEFLTTGDVAKIAGLTSQGALHCIKRGDLVPAARTKGGILLFRASDVDAFLKTRNRAGRSRRGRY